MTGRDGMSDAEVRAELKKAGPGLDQLWDAAITGKPTTNIVLRGILVIAALRRLAEMSLRDRQSQRALGEIVKLTEAGGDPMQCIDAVLGIARKHWKEKS